MELTEVLQILNDSIAVKQKEIDTLNLTISILTDKFTPELQVLENARAEATAKDIIISEKQAEIDELKTVPVETVKEII